MSPRRRRTRGQSLVELALLLPVLATLFLGSWTAADLIADNNVAAQATRAGARFAAELGNNGWSPGGSTDPTNTDTQIINQMLPVINGKLTNAVITEIDIYQPSGCTGSTPYNAGACPPNNGAYCCGEHADIYPVNGGVVDYVSGAQTYGLDRRVQTHPQEAELGVRVVFSYTSPTLRVFTQQDSQYTVVRLAPDQ